MSPTLQKSLLGFASGVMVAACFWSLLDPAIELESASGRLSVIPAAVGFLLGIGFVIYYKLKDYFYKCFVFRNCFW